MTYHCWNEIEQFAKILEAEAAGHPVDVGHAVGLARTLASLCPDIARSMHLAAERLERSFDQARSVPA
jgi:hypothetical protein